MDLKAFFWNSVMDPILAGNRWGGASGLLPRKSTGFVHNRVPGTVRLQMEYECKL